VTHFVTLFEEDHHHRSATCTADRPWGILSSSWGVSEACCRPDWPTRHDSTMSDYSHRPGGSLKLKGRVADGGVKKKYETFVHLIISIRPNTNQLLRKKKSSKSQDKQKNTEDETKDPVKEPERIRSDSPAGSSGRNSPAASSSRPDRKTQAEKRFEEVQRKRVSPFLKFRAGASLFLIFLRQLLEKVAKQAHMTHKDRVHEFNAQLEALSEHHDIPKVCGFNRWSMHDLTAYSLTGWARITTAVVLARFPAGVFHKRSRAHPLGVTYAFLLLITTMSNTLVVRASP